MTSTDIPTSLPQTPIADAVLGSVARRDFSGLAELLEPDVVLRALLPDGIHEWTGPERVTAAFVRWFSNVDEFKLLAATAGMHGPRLQLGWRARVAGGRFGAVALIVEQHVYADPGPTGRIQSMAMLCSGFTKEHVDA